MLVVPPRGGRSSGSLSRLTGVPSTTQQRGAPESPSRGILGMQHTESFGTNHRNFRPRWMMPFGIIRLGPRLRAWMPSFGQPGPSRGFLGIAQGCQHHHPRVQQEQRVPSGSSPARALLVLSQVVLVVPPVAGPRGAASPPHQRGLRAHPGESSGCSTQFRDKSPCGHDGCYRLITPDWAPVCEPGCRRLGSSAHPGESSGWGAARGGV